MKKIVMKKRILSMVLIMSMIIMLLPDLVFHNKVYAASASDICQPSVFIKQSQGGTCTLASATMIIRRAAILQGDPDWESITEADVRKVAWNDGLSSDFIYKHNGISYRIKRGDLPRFSDENAANKSKLISLLNAHPEGIAIFRNFEPKHAVLLTDYTDGVFYCADPSKSKPEGRMNISNAFSVTTENAKRYWYLVTPKCILNSTAAFHDPDNFKVSFSRTLYYKSSVRCMSGDDVMYMQMCLKYLGYNIDPDGWYGPASASFVKSFQSDYRVSPVDGRCCSITWKAIEKAVNDAKQTGIVTSFNVSKKSPQVENTTIKLTASGGSKYKFYSECAGTRKLIQNVSTKKTCDWKPTKAGTYQLYADIMDSSGNLLASRKITYVITKPEFKATISAQYASPQNAGSTIKLKVKATGGTGTLKYKFYSECNGIRTKLWDYDTNSEYNWHATTVGTHTVYCDVMDSSGKTITCHLSYKIVKGTSFVVDLNANMNSGQYTGTEIKLKANSYNGKGTVKYKYYMEKGGTWTTLKNFSTQEYILWTPTEAGYYNLYVDAKDSNGSTACKRLCFTVESGTPLKIKSLTANPSSPTTDSSVKLTGTTTGGDGNVTYKFYYELDGTRIQLKDFSATNTCSFTPSKAGTYCIYMDAIDGKKNLQSKMIKVVVR